jgi:hypothetical protein
MPRSLQSSKGQWFIISAVVISGVFVIISSMLRVSFGIDASDVARRNEHFYFNNIKEQVGNVELRCQQGSDFAKDLSEFLYFSQKSMESKGYFFFMNYTIDGCTARSLGIMIASEKGMFYQNVDPNELIPGII